MKKYTLRSPFMPYVGYDEARKILVVQYGSGQQDIFDGVPEVEVANLCTAPSAKDYFHQYIEPNFQKRSDAKKQ